MDRAMLAATIDIFYRQAEEATARRRAREEEDLSLVICVVLYILPRAALNLSNHGK